jgi:hypothetical protein
VPLDHEVSPGCRITWTLCAQQAQPPIGDNWIGTSWSAEVTATHLCMRSAGAPLAATPACAPPQKDLLPMVWDRCCRGMAWFQDSQLHGDGHRYWSNGAGAMATLRIEAMNLLRLAGLRSIRALSVCRC